MQRETPVARNLSKALGKAFEATQLDQSEHYDMAVRAYDDACSLLEAIPTDAIPGGEMERLVDLVPHYQFFIEIYLIFAQCVAYTTRTRQLMESNHATLTPRHASASWKPVAVWQTTKASMDGYHALEY